MKFFLRVIHSDLYKVIHTKLLWIHLVVPLLGIMLAGGYLLQSSWEEVEKVTAYMQLVSVVFPFIITVVITMLFETDLAAGKFQNVLLVPCSKIVSHAGNLLSVLIFGMVASVFTTVGFGAFARIAGLQSMSFSFYGITGLYLFMTNIAVYLLQYMICFTWGKSISMGVGITGTLLSAMLVFGMGDSIWKCCPYSYGIRCISYFLYRNLKPEIYVYMEEENRTGICAVTAVTALLFMLFLGWSYWWQGTREKEE